MRRRTSAPAPAAAAAEDAHVEHAPEHAPEVSGAGAQPPSQPPAAEPSPAAPAGPPAAAKRGDENRWGKIVGEFDSVPAFKEAVTYHDVPGHCLRIKKTKLPNSKGIVVRSLECKSCECVKRANGEYVKCNMTYRAESEDVTGKTTLMCSRVGSHHVLQPGDKLMLPVSGLPCWLQPGLDRRINQTNAVGVIDS